MNLIQGIANAIGDKAAIVTIQTVTELKLNKKHRETGQPCPFTQGVIRRATRNVVIGGSYENIVNNRREKEGEAATFDAQSLWQGKGRRLNRHFAFHADSGQVYLVYMPLTDKENNVKTVEDEYIDLNTGKVIDPKEVFPYLPPVVAPKNQGVEKTVFWRTVKIENVVAIVYAGTVFVPDNEKVVVQEKEGKPELVTV